MVYICFNIINNTNIFHNSFSNSMFKLITLKDTAAQLYYSILIRNSWNLMKILNCAWNPMVWIWGTTRKRNYLINIFILFSLSSWHYMIANMVLVCQVCNLINLFQYHDKEKSTYKIKFQCIKHFNNLFNNMLIKSK